jgi:hypothetical protein
MNDSNKVDLSALDPASDAARWENLIQSVMRRGPEAALRQGPTLTTQLVAWARPTLGVAAAAALLSWVGVATRGAPLERPMPEEEPAVSVLARWAAQDEQPSALSILEVLGSER